MAQGLYERAGGLWAVGCSAHVSSCICICSNCLVEMLQCCFTLLKSLRAALSILQSIMTPTPNAPKSTPSRSLTGPFACGPAIFIPFPFSSQPQSLYIPTRHARKGRVRFEFQLPRLGMSAHDEITEPWLCYARGLSPAASPKSNGISAGLLHDVSKMP